ncbi:hypothetical protein RND81_08G196000 [Saponaria officinalis]|uniref:Uncharacterized protein n=1 Tax=Saponaria officinalis TaxID=3572 RepID=A0AAW1JAM3_SAPOF
MQKKVNSLEEGKYSTFVNKTRVLPTRVLIILLMFLILCGGFSFVNLKALKKLGFDSVINVVSPNYEPCILEGNLGFSNVNLMHNMSDEELFWRATLVPRIEKYPFDRTPKIAFMFLTKGPLPLAPLWERFFKGHERRFSIYVHPMPGYIEDFASSSVFYRRQIPSKVAEWGEMSMCDAERRLLANALLDFSNERFVLLSESCIPLYNFTVIYNYITGSKYSFMGSLDELGRDGRGRYNENMAPEVNLTEWRKSSQWFEINRKLAIDVVEDTFYYPKFKAFCRPNCYVDEHYFPTMLTIQSPHLLANRTVTYVDWSRGGAHPATFGREDITPEFFDKILKSKTCEYNHRNSSICNLFARKFAPSTLEPLLQLSPTVLGF